MHTAEVLAVGHDVVLPAEIAPHDIARLEVGMTRFDHLSDGERLHDIAERNRGLVGSARHPDALRRIDRQPQSPDQHLSVRGLRHRCLIPAKLIPGQLAGRTSAQDPLATLLVSHERSSLSKISLSILDRQRHDLGARSGVDRVARQHPGRGRTGSVSAEEKQYPPSGQRYWLRPVAHLPVSIKERMGLHLIGWDD